MRTLNKILAIVFVVFVQHVFAQTFLPVKNATNVCVDMQFKLTFSATPVLQSSGAVKLYKSNGTLVSTIDLSTMPTGTPMSATWPWTETLNSTTIRVMRAEVDSKTAIFTFPINSMSYGANYYVTVDQSVFSNASALGFSGVTVNQWAFTVKAKPAVDLDYTVAADGSGDFATLQGALDFVPSGNTTAGRIYIKNGVYTGLAYTTNRNNLTICGESMTGVVLKGFNNSNLNASTHWRSVVNLAGNDLLIYNITFTNTTPINGTQAEALKMNGLRCIILNCEFYSYQDTVLIEGKVYFKDCVLEGDVDFMWGVGTVYFQSCEIRANDNGGYNVMARNDNTKHGYCFADCKLTRTSTATATQYLGRDAGTGYPYANIVYLNCLMDSHIPAVGWQINSAIDGSLIFFAEYKSVDMSGNLKTITSRHAKSRQLTDSEALLYRDLNWYFNGWLPVVPSISTKPVVAITAPANNASFVYKSPITLTATATDADGTIASVAFYNGTTLLGTVTAAPYAFTWSSAPGGTNTITAVATNNSGNKTTSTAVTITVLVPTTYVYSYPSGTDLWTNTTYWTPARTPSNIDTAIIRSGEVRLASDFGGVVKVEPNGTFRLTDSISVTDLRLQGGTLKSYTSNPVFILTTTLVAEQASTVMAGSLSTSFLCLNGTVKGSGNLTKTSVGTLRINASASTYTGTWIVKEGRLQVRSATGLGLCGVEVDSAANLDIEAAASTNALVIKAYGTLNLDANLTVQAAVLGDQNIPAGTYTAASYPAVITGAGTLTVGKSILTVGEPSAGSITLTAGSGSTYSWSTGSTSTTLVPAATGAYTVTATTSAGCALASAPVNIQVISLAKGWNLISTNLRPADSSIATLFNGINVNEVKTMGTFWRAGQLDAFNTLTTLTPGNGYLVNMATAGKLMVAGTPNLEGFENLQGLQAGWQLIGCPFQSATLFSTYFNSLNCSEIKGFNGFWIPAGQMNSISNLEPGKGYFTKK